LPDLDTDQGLPILDDRASWTKNPSWLQIPLAVSLLVTAAHG